MLADGYNVKYGARSIQHEVKIQCHVEVSNQITYNTTVDVLFTNFVVYYLFSRDSSC